MFWDCFCMYLHAWSKSIPWFLWFGSVSVGRCSTASKGCWAATRHRWGDDVGGDRHWRVLGLKRLERLWDKKSDGNMTRTPRLSRWQLGSEASAAVNGGNGSSVKRPGGPGWKNGLLILVALDLARRRICLKVDFGNSERIRNVQTCPNSCYCCDRKNTFWECARSITCFCTVDLDCFQIKYLQGKESWRCLRTKREGQGRHVWRISSTLPRHRQINLQHQATSSSNSI